MARAGRPGRISRRLRSPAKAAVWRSVWLLILSLALVAATSLPVPGSGTAGTASASRDRWSAASPTGNTPFAGPGGATVPDGPSPQAPYNVSSFTATPALFELGTANRSTTTLQVNLSGFRTATVFYQYWGLPPGCSSLDQPTLACTPNAAGEFVIEVAVTDLAGDNETANLTVTVQPQLSASPGALPSSPDTGQPVRFESGARGGVPPYQFSWRFGDGSGSTLPTPQHSYAAPGPYTARLWINDTGGGAFAGSLPVSVGSGPAVVLVAVDPRPPVGAMLHLRANVSGGRAPLTYSYSGLPPDCSSSNASSIQCVLVEAGTFLATVEVTDSAGDQANASTRIVVGFGFTLLAPAVVTQGQGFTIQAIPTGSFGALTYAYTGLPTGCATSNGSELNCTPEDLGTSEVTVTVSDAFGDSVSHSAQVQTVGSGSAPLGTAAELLLIEVAALIGAIAIGLLSWSRGMRRGPPPQGRRPPRPWDAPREPPPGAMGTVETRRPP